MKPEVAGSKLREDAPRFFRNAAKRRATRSDDVAADDVVASVDGKHRCKCVGKFVMVRKAHVGTSDR